MSKLINSGDFPEFSQIHLQDEKHPSLPRPTISRRTVSLILAIFLFLGFTLLYLQTLQPPQTIYSNCGDSPAEARRRGCSFDILSMAWQTPECYDHDNTEAFRLSHEWSYFADEHKRVSLSEEEVLMGERTTFTTVRYHRTHCTYMWRQMHRAFTVLRHIDSHLGNWNHTLHCQGVMLEREEDWDEVGAVGVVIFPSCTPV